MGFLQNDKSIVFNEIFIEKNKKSFTKYFIIFLWFFQIFKIKTPHLIPFSFLDFFA